MQTDQPPASNNEYSTPAQFRSKLGSYLGGVVIGFSLLGMIYLMKHYATRSQPPANTQAIPTAPQTTPQTESQP